MYGHHRTPVSWSRQPDGEYSTTRAALEQLLPGLYHMVDLQRGPGGVGTGPQAAPGHSLPEGSLAQRLYAPRKRS